MRPGLVRFDSAVGQDGELLVDDIVSELSAVGIVRRDGAVPLSIRGHRIGQMGFAEHGPGRFSCMAGSGDDRETLT